MTRVLLALLALSFPGFAQGQTWIVDAADGPGTDFLDIQSAVAAAANGDAVIVRAGSYAGDVTIDQKGLVLAADIGVTPTIAGDWSVSNLAAGQRVVVRGFTKENGESFSAALHDNAGLVWVEDCRFHCQAGFVVFGSCAPLVVTDCAEVVLLDVRATAWDPENGFAVASAGLQVNASEVYAYGCRFEGSDIAFTDECFAGFGFAPDGGRGLTADASTLYLYECSVEGGKGGNAQFFGKCGGCAAGSGGIGARLTGGSTVFWNQTNLMGGGAGIGTGCSPGSVGLPTSVDGTSAFNNLLGFSRTLDANTPIAAGGQIVIDLDTPLVGEVSFVYAATSPLILPLIPSFGGVFLLSPPLFFLGTITSPGSLTITAPSLGPGVFLEGHLQGVSVTPTGNVRLTGPTGFTVLGA